MKHVFYVTSNKSTAYVLVMANHVDTGTKTKYVAVLILARTVISMHYKIVITESFSTRSINYDSFWGEV